MDSRYEMMERARLLRGLAKALTCDADYIYDDIRTYDIVCMTESIRDIRETIDRLMDNITELEYMLYLAKRGESR